MIKIDKNIPLPDVRVEYPFHSMEVGDSFFASSRGVHSAVSQRNKRHKETKFIVRKYATGFRVWRVQ